MRHIVEREIIQYYIKYKDLGLTYINYLRKKNRMVPLTGITDGDYPKIIDNDVAAFLKQLSDEELFIALDYQFCDRYR
jgi:hypothetical protein